MDDGKSLVSELWLNIENGTLGYNFNDLRTKVRSYLTAPVPRVIIGVCDGLVGVEAKDAGIEVSIKNYDVDGSERNLEEVDGEKFVFSEWGVDDIV